MFLSLKEKGDVPTSCHHATSLSIKISEVLAIHSINLKSFQVQNQNGKKDWNPLDPLCYMKIHEDDSHRPRAAAAFRAVTS